LPAHRFTIPTPLPNHPLPHLRPPRPFQVTIPTQRCLLPLYRPQLTLPQPHRTPPTTTS
jgi:hypothetical protein